MAINRLKVKPNINYTEIQTKHGDILNNICNGNVYLEDKFDPDTIIKIYLGGELTKTGNVYHVNLLSGTFSVNQVEATNISNETKAKIIDLFTSKLGNDTNINIS